MEEDGRRFARPGPQLGKFSSIVSDFTEVMRSGREVSDGVDDGSWSGGNFALGGSEAFGEGGRPRRLTNSSWDASQDFNRKDGVLGVEVLERSPRAIEASEISVNEPRLWDEPEAIHRKNSEKTKLTP